MGFALLLLGLVPLMFLPEMAVSSSSEDDELPQDSGGSGAGDLLDDEPGGNNETDLENDTDILNHIDEDDGADTGDEMVDPETVLSPENEDDAATPSDGSEGDVLKPIDEIESTLETIWIDGSSDTGLAYAEIEDFETGQDILHISMAPESITGELDVDVTQSDNGMDALVFVENELIAILKGAPDATVDDIVVAIESLAA